MQSINATQARELFPNVKGEIQGGILCSGYALLYMGPSAFGVMVGGELIACCPTPEAAHAAGKAGWKGVKRARKSASRAEQHGRYIDCGPDAWDDR